MPASSRRPFFLLFACCLTFSSHQPHVRAADKKMRVLAATFPIYQIVRNINQGGDAIEVGLMIPAMMGCPHMAWRHGMGNGWLGCRFR